MKSKNTGQKISGSYIADFGPALFILVNGVFFPLTNLVSVSMQTALVNSAVHAQNTKTAGIPVYTIGLAQNPEIIPGETQILNDSNSSATTGGIAGNGGKFFLVTKTSDLRKTFENIARQLVQLVE